MKQQPQPHIAATPPRGLYVMIDQQDGFVNLSPDLYKAMGAPPADGSHHFFVFREKGDDCYCFILDPRFTFPAQTGALIIEPDTRMPGFETLKPTASYIFYCYGISSRRATLHVMPCTLGKLHYYKILKPKTLEHEGT